MTWQIGCWISQLFGLHLLSVFCAAVSHLTCYMLRALGFVTPILTEQAMSWLWGLVEMWWSHASPTHSQLSNSCKVSGSRIWSDMELFPTFKSLRVWYFCMWTAAWQKETATVFSRQQQLSVTLAVKGCNERPDFALNMRDISDSCQPPAALGGNQRLNDFKSLCVSWHMSRSPVAPPLTSVSTVQLRPLNEFSLQFQLCPVLAHFHYKTKRQCQAKRTEQLCTTASLTVIWLEWN